MSNELEKIVKYIRGKGLKVNKDARKVLDFFSKRDVTRFLGSGFGSSMSSIDDYLAKELGMKVHVVSRLRRQYEELGLLEDQRGESSISGREYNYGFTPFALYNIMCKRRYYF